MNKPCINCVFSFVSDGSANSVAISLATGPISYSTPDPALPVLNGAFAGLPSDAINIFAGGGLTATKNSLILGVLTLGLTGTQTAGTIYQVYATLVY